MEGQAVTAALNNAVHLRFQLRVEFGQTTAHIAVLADFFGNNFVQRHAAFFNPVTRAFVNPRQRATQFRLIIFGLLALGRGERVRLAVVGDVAVGGNNKIAVFPFHLHGLRVEHHVITRGDAALVVSVGGGRRERKNCRQQRFAHHNFPSR